VIAIAVAYLLFPIDLIPDMTGVGVLDDLALMGLLAWFYRSQVGKLQSTDKGPRQLPARANAFDPYQVLGVPASASSQAIRTAYRARMSEYHPDKVAHLGKELQDLAHRKSVEIQQAYQLLSR
jgi:DnaJ like chaperone protein